jgi:hypothetical protein
MNVSANIIRFPAQPVITAQPTSEQPAEPAGVIAFSPALTEDFVDPRTQSHGQMFAAHRIAGRVADQLDQIAAL